MREKVTREERSWILYDWANSVYATIMMAAVFPIYFSSVAGGAGQSGDYWWGIGTSAGMIIVALLAPIIGALSDFIGYRKRLFLVFFGLGIVFTLASAFFGGWQLLLLGYAVSHIGFTGANLVYDSFLPDVTTPERMDRISGYGFAFGYIGGSTIPFLVSIGLITIGGELGWDSSLPVKISVAITAVWWALFTIPFLKNVHQRHGIEKPQSGNLIKEAFSQAVGTAKKIVKDRRLLLFILAYFFYIDGVGTVISMSTAYGETLGLDTTKMILALLVTQLVAFPCSILFSRLAKSIGSLNMLRIAVSIYVVICAVGFIMGFGLEEGYFGIGTATVLFWILAVMVGTVQGGIQATSRSYFAKMIPPENSGEYFGFFDIFGKFASVLGPFLYAMIKGATGRSSFAILSIAALFIAGLLTLGVRRTES
ncbi:MAG: MFS transporter [Clostridiales bacterium]|jgi:UMF1 family MFS transporter|nr:MFS transporter [Clostridiales bacterium]